MREGYPDDIANYDNDPRSPFYDDKGYSDFVDERVAELMEDVSEIDTDLISNEVIAEIVIDGWADKSFASELDKVFWLAAEKQAEQEWGQEHEQH